MDESERLERWKKNYNFEECGIFPAIKDEDLANRIAALLNHPKIDKYCMVDAYYHDFSSIPNVIYELLDLCGDAYLIFGITTEGEIVSKWVDRWDLDSNDPIVEGKVIHNLDDAYTGFLSPPKGIPFDRNLLSTPIPDIINKMFGKNEE